MVSSKLFLPRKIQLAVLSAIAVAFASVPLAVAHHDPNGTCEFDKGTDPVKCGELSKLIPVPKDAIHAGLTWTKASKPKICMGMRPSEYAGFHLTFKDENGHDQLFEPFRHFVYGGAGFSEGTHGLDESNTKGNTARENFVCWDVTHADAFKQTDHFSLIDENDPPNELVTKADFALNDAAFSDAGNSKGLDYNMFCSGNVALSDGKWLFIGGHDKGGNNGIRKLTVFDPRDESWAQRVVPPVKAAYLDIFDQLTPQSLPQDFPDFPNANNENNTDPVDPSDMKYQRWYPSGALLPDETVLIVAGTDRNTSLLPGNPPGGCTAETRNTHVNCSLVTQVVPEIYDPETDSTIALENARKHHNTFPRVYPVQTGNKVKDWKVAIIGEVSPNSLEKDGNGKPILGRPLLSVARQYDPYTYTGKTYLLDVKATKADSSRDTPAENYYQFVDQAKNAHNFGAGAQLWETDNIGHGVSQKVVLFGGDCSGTDADPVPETCARDLIETIDFQDSSPKYKQSNAKLYLPVQQNNTTVLPDGKVLISGGVVSGRGPWVNSFHLQLYDPQTDTIETLVDRKIAGHDHSTIALLPDGTVALLGGNATDLHGDEQHIDLGIPVAQLYKPPYFFKGGSRPEIKDAPEEISYHRRFNIQLSEGAGNIKSVALIAFGPITHNWDWGKRYVKLWFEQKKDKLLVQAPAFPGLAVPMHYMLFVVDDKGVPSVAKLIQLKGTPAS
ncbi:MULTISPECIES: galactose oxidase early set domain-containing protein [Nitrosomonas]|uniref:Uncharacterized protein DUF1929 n=1 Tax=Nitrosomonas communis TaxID=44574 RepID=A0A0F7KGC2_9PROT|nr:MULTISPECIES: galactose oxidase early set domain-containing protein [Nitrosomonas]AKH38516.1 hypothetical protein AAW31_13075 [Nitrosomonas communis]TYP89257.1 uncharacterized protein DUF1929 [Nitrosomonas communis]UVS60560.1 galactose oxidase early set domain-containing protein [Nitrosomonas sp. PLL12]